MTLSSQITTDWREDAQTRCVEISANKNRECLHVSAVQQFAGAHGYAARQTSWRVTVGGSCGKLDPDQSPAKRAMTNYP